MGFPCTGAPEGHKASISAGNEAFIKTPGEVEGDATLHGMELFKTVGKGVLVGNGIFNTAGFEVGPTIPGTVDGGAAVGGQAQTCSVCLEGRTG